MKLFYTLVGILLGFIAQFILGGDPTERCIVGFLGAVIGGYGFMIAIEILRSFVTWIMMTDAEKQYWSALTPDEQRQFSRLSIDKRLKMVKRGADMGPQSYA